MVIVMVASQSIDVEQLKITRISNIKIKFLEGFTV